MNSYSEYGFLDFFVEVVFSQGFLFFTLIVVIFAFLCFRFYKLNFTAVDTSESENNGSYKMGLNISLLMLMGTAATLYFLYLLYSLL
ncbi:hypothetical protein [Intestinicryptomonas porci]|uniref:Uncharacterized protein n=1 Tax=Intestinicryptomonas porci TaxID=2926320 RepID=A0ABU4WHS8_9BACT|nr:hypothetical protein [Opitutales bacterium CLA-KB-P66]